MIVCDCAWCNKLKFPLPFFSQSAHDTLHHRSNPTADSLPRVQRIVEHGRRLGYQVAMSRKRFGWQMAFPQDIVDEVIYAGVDDRR